MNASLKNVLGRPTTWRQGILLFAAAVVLCVWGLTAIVIIAQREAALAQARANATNLSAAFEEQIHLVMSAVVGAMDLIDHRIQLEGSAFDLGEWAGQIPGLAASTVQMAIIGADGKLVATTMKSHPEPVDLSDREHFRVHLNNPSHGVFIGKPVLGRVSGQVTIQVTKRLEHADGSFAGVLLFSLSPEYLTTLHRKVDLGRTGVITLAGTDGVIRARFTATSPDGTAALGASLKGTRALAESASASNGMDEDTSPFDHVTRIFHWRRVEGFPLVAIVGLGKAEALEPVNRHALELAGIAAIVTLVLAIFTKMLHRDVDRRARQDIALAEESARLRRSQEHLARAQRVSSTGSDERDLKTDRGEWSDEVYHIMGVTPKSFVPTTANFLALVHPDDRHVIVATHAEIALGVCPAPFEYRMIRPDGTVRWIYREVELIRDESGNPVSLLGTVKDITELHAAQQRQAELERDLLHSQKLEALGTLAGGIAHDLNNALVPILALTPQIARRSPVGSRDRSNLEMVTAAARRARDLVKQILAFSRKEAPERQQSTSRRCCARPWICSGSPCRPPSRLRQRWPRRRRSSGIRVNSTRLSSI